MIDPAINMPLLASMKAAFCHMDCRYESVWTIPYNEAYKAVRRCMDDYEYWSQHTDVGVSLKRLMAPSPGEVADVIISIANATTRANSERSVHRAAQPGEIPGWLQELLVDCDLESPLRNSGEVVWWLQGE